MLSGGVDTSKVVAVRAQGLEVPRACAGWLMRRHGILELMIETLSSQCVASNASQADGEAERHVMSAQKFPCSAEHAPGGRVGVRGNAATGAYRRRDLAAHSFGTLPTGSCSSSTPTTVPIDSRHPRALKERRQSCPVTAPPTAPSPSPSPSDSGGPSPRYSCPRASLGTPETTHRQHEPIVHGQHTSGRRTRAVAPHSAGRIAPTARLLETLRLLDGQTQRAQLSSAAPAMLHLHLHHSHAAS